MLLSGWNSNSFTLWLHLYVNDVKRSTTAITLLSSLDAHAESFIDKSEHLKEQGLGTVSPLRF